MNKFIKYERIETLIKVEDLPELFNTIVTSGNEIIFYKEDYDKLLPKHINVIIVVGRRNYYH